MALLLLLPLPLARVVPPAATLIPQPLLHLRLRLLLLAHALLLDTALALEDVGVGMGMRVGARVNMAMGRPMSVTTLCQRMSVARAVAIAVRIPLSQDLHALDPVRMLRHTERVLAPPERRVCPLWRKPSDPHAHTSALCQPILLLLLL